MPPLKTIVHQEFISSAGLQPYEMRIRENDLHICPHLDNGRLGSEANKRRALWTCRLRNLFLFEPPCPDAPKRRNSQMIGQRDAPEMQSVDCSGLWPKKSIISGVLMNMIPWLVKCLSNCMMSGIWCLFCDCYLARLPRLFPNWLCRGFLSHVCHHSMDYLPMDIWELSTSNITLSRLVLSSTFF